MTIAKKLAVLGVVALALGATACGSSTETTSASSTTTAAPTTTSEAESSTTTEKDDSSTTKVTKPVKIEKIDEADLPESARELPSEFEFTEEEENCVDTVIYEYVQDPTNATDDATLAGVLGGAMAACVDSGTIAVAIVDQVRAEVPQLTETQATCLENEIAGADTESLAIFLGAFAYSGPGAAEIQEPFLTALGEACELG